jgi:hypothetical protein
MDNEGAAHAEDAAKQARFEDDIVSRRRLTRPRQRRCLRAASRPVVLSEHECREVDFMSQLKEAFECSGPRIEGCHPRFYVRDIFETTGQCPEQLRLLS